MSRTSARRDAAVVAYVEAIGADATVDLLLAFGGTKLYLAADPKSRSSLAGIIGRDAARKLAASLGPGHVLVPTGKPWLARQLRAKEWTVADIARKLHTHDGTIRRYLNA